jgi:hypothetical protein
MGPLEITGTARLVLGLATGIAFGFILQKGQALKFHKIVNALRLTDFTIWKLMFTAVGVGMLGVYGLHELGLVKLHIKETVLSANIVGGLIFGAGFALLGFCPGTCVGAAGEGRLDGLYSGIVGLLIGAGLYAEVHPFLLSGFLKVGALGKATLPQVLGLGVWPTVVLVAATLGAAVLFLNRLDRRMPSGARSVSCTVPANAA